MPDYCANFDIYFTAEDDDAADKQAQVLEDSIAYGLAESVIKVWLTGQADEV